MYIYFLNLYFVLYSVYMRPKIPITKASSTEHIHFQGVIVTLHSLAIFKAAGDFGMPWIAI